MKKGTWELVDLYPGCHVRVKINNYYHHGIYVGEGNVVQFGMPFDALKFEASDVSQIKVILSPLKDFTMGNNFIEVYCYSKSEARQKQKESDIIKTAMSHLGDSGYNILTNNCEHFANYCVFLKKQSDQIDEIYDEVKKKLK